MLLPIHVAAGGLALVLGAVALLVKKGSVGSDLISDFGVAAAVRRRRVIRGRWIIDRDPRRIFRFASLQSAAGRAALADSGAPSTAPPLESAVLIDRAGAHTRSDAAIWIELSETPRRWTGSLGSNGFLDGAFDDDQKPTRLRVREAWCIDARVPPDNVPASLRGQPRGK
jgi:hypothetical protein